MKIEAYLFLDGRTEEALEFYKSALGAEVTALMRFKDAPDQPSPGWLPPGSENKIMHSSFVVGDTTVMASDGQCQGKPQFEGVSLALQPDSGAETERLFGLLAEGGDIQMPLGPSFFATHFGMVKDRFGVAWMLVGPAPAG